MKKYEVLIEDEDEEYSTGTVETEEDLEVGDEVTVQHDLLTEITGKITEIFSVE